MVVLLHSTMKYLIPILICLPLSSIGFCQTDSLRQVLGNNRVNLYNNYKQGIWQYYDECDILVEEKKFNYGHAYYWNYWLNGVQILKEGNGELIEYYDNGKTKSQGKIKDGKKWGDWIEFAPNGNLSGKISYVEWVGIYSSELEFKTHILETYDSTATLIGNSGYGYRILYQSDGKLKKKEFYHNYNLDSLFTYYPNGFVFETFQIRAWQKVHIQSNYSNGITSYKMEGDTQKFWDNTGVLEKQIEYISEAKGAFNMNTTYFYKDGQKKEVSLCKMTLSFNDHFEEIVEMDCESFYLDEK